MKTIPMLSAKEIISVNAFASCFSIQYAPDFFFAGETHDFWEFVAVREGLAGVTADDRILQLHPGQIIFHKPMEFHRIWAAEGTSPAVTIVSFRAAGEAMNRFCDAILFLSHSQRGQLDSIAAVGQKLFDTYYIRRGADEPAALQELKLRTELFLLSLLDNDRSEATAPQSSAAETYQEAIRYLRSHLGEPLTIAQAARHLGTSESNLKKLFQRFAGEGMIHYFNRMKINEAKTLLRQNYTIRQVSELLGFSSQAYFSLAFKKATGSTPNAFRR